MTSQGTANGRFQRAIHSATSERGDGRPREMGRVSLAAAPALCSSRDRSVAPLVRWSPDRRKLLYTTGRDTAIDAWVVNIDGTHRTRVIHHQSIEGIAWRPAFGQRQTPRDPI